MAETVKTADGKKIAAKKGRAKDNINEDEAEVSRAKEPIDLEQVDAETESRDTDSVDTESDKTKADSEEPSKDSEEKEAADESVKLEDDSEEVSDKPEKDYLDSDDTDEIKKKLADDDFLASVREQVENCKEELQIALRKSLREEFGVIVERQVAKANRRRHWNNFFHDIVIILLAVVTVYFGCCLYDMNYFNFPQSNSNQTTLSPDNVTDNKDSQTAGPVKDATWYVANYSYLFNNLQINANADDVSAYYLYSDDYKINEIKPEYLLAMTYNQVAFDSSISNLMITITDAEMQRAFKATFGTLDYYERVDFHYGCLNFTFSKIENAFIAESVTCNTKQRRSIIENIERIYEEGEVIYVLTNAAVYDANEQVLYSFDNLFQPVATNVQASELSTYTAKMNRYQYQFKKSGDNYYFSSITKLQ